MPPTPPLATYRLQLSRDFDFAAAGAAVPYLKALGISHLYLSPIWAAAPGSSHGYDVTDHSRVNDELGGLGGYYDLCRTAREHGLGIVLDIVPNHVGIANHPWWRDVLRFGPRSPFATYFDIDWEGQPQQDAGVLVYPVLGQPFGQALEAAELSLDYDGAEIVVRYYDRSFPIAPRGYAEILGFAPPVDDASRAREVVALLEDLTSATPQAAALLLDRLAELASASADIRDWIARRVSAFNGTAGQPDSFNDLERLLRAQHYRLAYWRVSAEEINYRRFFDINDLAAIRVEDDAVFGATHSLVRELVASDMVDGLRVDHVDGLYDPGEYLRRLRLLASPNGASRPVWVEKILGRGEPLPRYWPVEGTTGYDFLAVAGGLFVDPSAEQPLTAIYREFVGDPPSFADAAFAAKRRVSGRSFAGETNVLALRLYHLAQERRLARDNTLGALREAIAAVLSAMPVYRTYLDGDDPMPGDADLIREAAQEALRRDPNVTPEAVRFLAQVLLVDTDEPEERARWVRFRRRFQQLSGPVMAKGVEDTAFFRFNRLLACNEVGDDPAHFGVADAHEWFASRAETWPASMSASTTHDTKRSEDARMRLAALTSVPRAWHREVRAWARSNARHLRSVHGRRVPDPNMEYYFYQSLVASWEGRADAGYAERLQDHMTKAAREAKLETSWTRVDDEYESALKAFVRAALQPRRSARFLRRIDEFVAGVSPTAAVSSLGLLALKVTAPGVPDFFQGSEFPLHTLTDPDNRRPVDFAAAAKRIAPALEGHANPTDPLAKAWLTVQLLRIRREQPELFARGDYAPVHCSGPMAERVFAFSRTADGVSCVVVVLQRPAHLIDESGCVRPGDLDGTMLTPPPAAGWRDAIHGRHLAPGPLAVGELLAPFPVAVLLSEGTARD